MPKTIDLKQGSQEWKEWRRWKIGASDAPIIMGVSPFKSPLQLWEEKIIGGETPVNYAMARGTRMEESARNWVNAKHGHYGLKFKPACLQHDSIDWMIASLDGWFCGFKGCLDQFSFQRALEIKCPGTEAHMMALGGDVPHYYMPQLQHQMVVADVQEILYVSFDGQDGVEITVKRDDDYITKHLLPQEAAFYDSLINFKPPEPSDKDVVTITDSRAVSDSHSYVKIQNEIERLEKESSYFRERLIAHTSNGRSLIGDVKVTKVLTKGRVDYDKIPELKGVKLDKYRKPPVQSWRITT